jgi:amino acid permease
MTLESVFLYIALCLASFSCFSPPFLANIMLAQDHVIQITSGQFQRAQRVIKGTHQKSCSVVSTSANPGARKPGLKSQLCHSLAV